MSDGLSGTIGWIDLTVENAENVRDFYRAVAGWTAEPVDMGGYSDFNMIAPAVGEAVAGICHARGSNAEIPPQWLIYIRVDDLDTCLERVRTKGGEVLRKPGTGTGFGRFAVIRDPAGAVAALFEPKR